MHHASGAAAQILSTQSQSWDHLSTLHSKLNTKLVLGTQTSFNSYTAIGHELGELGMVLAALSKIFMTLPNLH